MSKKQQQGKPQPSYNAAVEHAYNCILKKSKLMLGTLERDELRCVLERKTSISANDAVVHELVSPLLYLRLECGQDGDMTIHFGIEPIRNDAELNSITSRFLRALFMYTASEHTERDIEGCIRTDWFINCCADAYEYAEMQGRNRVLKKLPHYPSLTRQGKALEMPQASAAS